MIGGNKENKLRENNISRRLHFAACTGRLDLLKEQIKAGGNVFTSNKINLIPIHVKLDANTINTCFLGDSPISDAVAFGHVDCVKVLIDAMKES